MQLQSTEFIAALADNNLRPFVVAEIIEGGASIYDDPLYTLQGISGSMDLDETRPARRKFGALKLIDKKGDLTPRSVGDLLHPNSGNEIRIRKGLNYKSLNLVPKNMAYPGRNGQLGPWRNIDPVGTGNVWSGGETTIGSFSKSSTGTSLILTGQVAGQGAGVEATTYGWWDPNWLRDGYPGQSGAMPALTFGLPWCAVCWVMPLGTGLNIQFALDFGYNNVSGAYAILNQDVPANVWSPLVITPQIVQAVLQREGPPPASGNPWSSIWVQINGLSGGGAAYPAGTSCAFDAFGVYPDGNADPQRPLKPQSEYNWLGFFRFDNQTVDDSGDALSLTLGGLDRAFAFQQARWTRPFQIPRNTTIPEAIRRILADRWTGKHPIQLDATACASHPIMSMTTPNAVFGADQTASDPWADCQTLAAVGGCELFPGPTGIVILRPFIDPSLVPISASYIESWKAGSDLEPGTFALIPPIGREIDPTKLFSGIIVTGGNSQDRPCRAEVWDTDPASPTYVGKVGYIPAYYDSPLLRDTLQCYIAGRGLLARIRLSSEVVTANIMPNPGHEGGDGVFLDRARAKATGIYVLSNFTMDLAPTGGMAITSRSTTDLGPEQASLT